MKITADLSRGALLINENIFPITCNVRTLKRGTRRSYEVVRSIPDNLPYDPQPFPRGLWDVTGIEWQAQKRFDPHTYGPVKIRTNAWRTVKVWELDGDKDYLRETARQVTDEAYLLHYSTSSTTLGCIRLASPMDAEAIANIIQGILDKGEEVKLEVI